MEISEFIEYVRRYRHDFVGIAHHYFHDEHEVEDAVQDALIRLWMARERKAKTRTSLCGSGFGGRQDIRP